MARILVIDDDPIILEMVKDILNKYSCIMYQSQWPLNITALTDPETALNVIQEHNFELIITDVLMARLDGWEFIKKIREKYPNFDVPIVVMSAIQGVDLEYQAMRNGASAWFHKPIHPREFATQVFRLIQAR